MTLSPLNIRTALTGPMPALDFVLPGLLPGSVGTVVGAGGVGKTTFLMQLAIAMSTNTATAAGLFPAPGVPHRVVLLAAEETRQILGFRLRAIHEAVHASCSQGELPGLDDCSSALSVLAENLILLPGAGKPVYLAKEGTPTSFFDELCQLCGGARLIIIDPLRRLHDGDENSSSAMTEIVQLLEALAKRTGAAVLAAHHMNKSAAFLGSTDAAASSRGSSALTDSVRWQANLSTMSESEAKSYGVRTARGSYVKLDFSKMNYAPPRQTVWMKRLDNGVLTQISLDRPPSTSRAGEGPGNRRPHRAVEGTYV